MPFQYILYKLFFPFQDEFELLPVNLADEDFLLPSEAIPEYVMKNLTDEDKKFVDFSGSYKKFISGSETDDDDTDKSQFKLKGSDKMKWFECPQVYKSNDRSSKRSYEGKTKLDANDSLNESIETKKVIRQYGKAGEVSSGTVRSTCLVIFKELNYVNFCLMLRLQCTISVAFAFT